MLQKHERQGLRQPSRTVRRNVLSLKARCWRMPNSTIMTNTYLKQHILEKFGRTVIGPGCQDQRTSQKSNRAGNGERWLRFWHWCDRTWKRWRKAQSQWKLNNKVTSGSRAKGTKNWQRRWCARCRTKCHRKCQIVQRYTEHWPDERCNDVVGKIPSVRLRKNLTWCNSMHSSNVTRCRVGTERVAWPRFRNVVQSLWDSDFEFAEQRLWDIFAGTPESFPMRYLINSAVSEVDRGPSSCLQRYSNRWRNPSVTIKRCIKPALTGDPKLQWTGDEQGGVWLNVRLVSNERCQFCNHHVRMFWETWSVSEANNVCRQF